MYIYTIMDNLQTAGQFPICYCVPSKHALEIWLGVFSIGTYPVRLFYYSWCQSNSQTDQQRIHGSDTAVLHKTHVCITECISPILNVLRFSILTIVQCSSSTQIDRLITKNLWRPRWQVSWGQHGAHLEPTGPRWAPCWSHELFHPGRYPITESSLKTVCNTIESR